MNRDMSSRKSAMSSTGETEHQADRTATSDRERIALLAHDLRSFLHVVKTSLYVLKNSRDDRAGCRDVLDVLEQDQQTAAAQLDELIALAKEAVSAA